MHVRVPMGADDRQRSPVRPAFAPAISPRCPGRLDPARRPVAGLALTPVRQFFPAPAVALSLRAACGATMHGG